MRQLKIRLRALGRSLRPLEQEANRLAQELEDRVTTMEENTDERDPAIDPRCEGHHQLTPREIKQYEELTVLQGLADEVYETLRHIREDIACTLRPAPKQKARRVG